MGHVFKTAGRWIVIAAMFSAFGGHWMALQSVAWTAMVFTNVKHSNLGQALEQTFDGKHPCEICKAVEKGRKSEKQQDTQAAIGKINFFFQASAVALVSPDDYRELRASDTFALSFFEAPLLRPPRGIAG